MSTNNAESSIDNDSIDNQTHRWWHHREFWLLVGMVALIYFTRLDAVSIRGEEPRRARIGIEMRETGDWIVPRQQGKPFLSRPPLQNWIIVGLGEIFGDVNAWAIRLPSVISMLMIVTIIYAYSLSFLSRGGSFTAAIAFASMPQVMELGRLGETEMLFTLLLAGSLFLWHLGYSRGWSAVKTWVIAYALIAMATLTKGPQAPVYFATSIGLFLLITRNWRFAISWAHLAGIVTFIVIWGAWQLPFMLKLGPAQSYAIYCNDVGLRFRETSWMITLTHMVEFPIEIFFACMLPWSILLFAYFNPRFLRAIGPQPRGYIIFLLCVIGVTFPTSWLVPNAHTRYFLPIYPFFAPLIGLVFDRCQAAQDSYRKTDKTRWWHRPWKIWWREWLVGTTLFMTTMGFVIFGISVFGDEDARFAQPLWFAITYLISTIILSFVALKSRSITKGLRRLIGPASVAIFMGLTFVGVFTNSLIRTSGNTAEAVAAIKQQLPDDVQLVSLGYAHHLFAYHYRDYIPMIKVPHKGKIKPPKSEYFCFQNRSFKTARLGFKYEIIAEISYERTKIRDPNKIMTVARKIKRTKGDQETPNTDGARSTRFKK